MEQKILDLVSKKLSDREHELVVLMSDGGCKSFDHYKELCGFIRGLRTAQLEMVDLVRNLKDNDDD
tara:strand:+ start:1522 stop:1719 length:198 start_codon:yes stop_codon:yes gene_type:complete